MVLPCQEVISHGDKSPVNCWWIGCCHNPIWPAEPRKKVKQTSGLDISRNFHLPNVQNLAFFTFFNAANILMALYKTIVFLLLTHWRYCRFALNCRYDLEESLVLIHLHKWQFYLPRAIRQWDMSSPGPKVGLVVYMAYS